jgi:hypothetical protein
MVGEAWDGCSDLESGTDGSDDGGADDDESVDDASADSVGLYDDDELGERGGSASVALQ